MAVKASGHIRRFMRRGNEAAASEWRVICGTHNLLKLYRRAIGDGSAAPYSRMASGCRPAATPAFRAPNAARTRHRCPPIRGTPVGFSLHQVEVAGIEPASFSFSMGLLRAQPAEGSRVPPRHRHRRGTPAS